MIDQQEASLLALVTEIQRASEMKCNWFCRHMGRTIGIGNKMTVLLSAGIVYCGDADCLAALQNEGTHWERVATCDLCEQPAPETPVEFRLQIIDTVFVLSLVCHQCATKHRMAEYDGLKIGV